MGRNYIPRPDADFTAWRANLVTYINTWFFQLGLTEEQVTALNTASINWGKDYAAHVALQAAAEAARTKKDETRAAFESVIRPMVRIAQANPGTTDAARAAMGIAVERQGNREWAMGNGRGGTVGPDGFTVGQASRLPSSHPVARIEPAGRLTHVVYYTDSATPTRRAKPRGVLGAEVWRAVVEKGTGVEVPRCQGDASDRTSPSAPRHLDTSAPRFDFLGLATGGSMRVSYEVADGGAGVVYVLRWVTREGGVGPWSPPGAATVAA